MYVHIFVARGGGMCADNTPRDILNNPYWSILQKHDFTMEFNNTILFLQYIQQNQDLGSAIADCHDPNGFISW